jgi:hypothetical protein
MKTFNEPFKKEEFVNEHGEKITLVWCSTDGLLYVHHTDCNDDFEEIPFFLKKYNISSEEKEKIYNFCFKCVEFGFDEIQKLKKEN